MLGCRVEARSVETLLQPLLLLVVGDGVGLVELLQDGRRVLRGKAWEGVGRRGKVWEGVGRREKAWEGVGVHCVCGPVVACLLTGELDDHKVQRAACGGEGWCG